MNMFTYFILKNLRIYSKFIEYFDSQNLIMMASLSTAWSEEFDQKLQALRYFKKQKIKLYWKRKVAASLRKKGLILEHLNGSNFAYNVFRKKKSHCFFGIPKYYEILSLFCPTIKEKNFGLILFHYFLSYEFFCRPLKNFLKHKYAITKYRLIETYMFLFLKHHFSTKNVDLNIIFYNYKKMHGFWSFTKKK
uniref:hypothetical protein n=1 Tax=Paramecium gigas TaxID=2709424 RepID=UPI001D012F2E|nr:hypothetical protein LI418_mgp10 [Paramecium gigas]QVG61504.1 hypothetical protein Pgigas_00020 [Paramecium gigas]